MIWQIFTTDGLGQHTCTDNSPAPPPAGVHLVLFTNAQRVFYCPTCDRHFVERRENRNHLVTLQVAEPQP